MSELLNTLFEQRMKAVSQMREIASRETPTAEDDAAYDKANDEVTRLGKLITDEHRNLANDKEQADALEAALRKVGVPKPHEVRTDAGGTATKWAHELRKYVGGEQSEIGSGVSMKLPTTLGPNMREAVTAEMRAALNINTATQGPELIPTELVNELFTKLFDDSGVLAAGPRILRTASGNPLQFPRITALGNLSQANSRVQEGAAINEGEPTFDQIVLNAYKYGQYAKASTEVLQDAEFDVQGIMGTIIGRNLANNLGQDLLTGSGANGAAGQPRGLAAVVGSNVVTSGTTVSGGFKGTGPSSPDEIGQLLDVIQLLKPKYRKGAQWLLNDTTMGKIRKFEANTTTPLNNYLWAPAAAPGLQDSILGYPVVVDMFMANMALSTLSIIFGNFDYYYLRLVNEVRVEWSTQVAFLNDQVVIRALLRADADAIDDAAFCGFKGAAS